MTRSCAALRAADLDWIVGPGYSSGWYILGCSKRLALCLRHSARIEITSTAFLLILLFLLLLLLSRHPWSPLVTPGHPWSPRSPQSVTPVTPVSLTFCLLFCTFLVFSVLFLYFVVLFHHFFCYFSLFYPILCKIRNIFSKNQKFKKKICWHVQVIKNIFLLQCLKKKSCYS